MKPAAASRLAVLHSREAEMLRRRMRAWWLTCSDRKRFITALVFGVWAYLHVVVAFWVAYKLFGSEDCTVSLAINYTFVPLLTLALEIYVYSTLATCGGCCVWVWTQHFGLSRVVTHNLHVSAMSLLVVVWCALLVALPVPLDYGASLTACSSPFFVLCLWQVVHSCLIIDGVFSCWKALLMTWTATVALIVTLKADGLANGVSVSNVSILVSSLVGLLVFMAVCRVFSELARGVSRSMQVALVLWVMVLLAFSAVLILLLTEAAYYFTNKSELSESAAQRLRGLGITALAIGFFVVSPLFGQLLYRISAAHWAAVADENVPLMLGIADSDDTSVPRGYAAAAAAAVESNHSATNAESQIDKDRRQNVLSRAVQPVEAA